MRDSREGKLHYARFALRWKSLNELKRETITLILSPHLDDIFLSLYATIVSGKLGNNIIGVNFFTASDSSISTNVNTSFNTIVRVSVGRMQEEIGFSRLLLSRKINYLPVFLGLKEASVERYYKFIAAALLGKLSKKESMREISLSFYTKMASDYSKQLNAWEALGPLLRHFRSNIRNVLAPMGVGTHIDHGAIAQTALKSVGPLNLGLYAEIPYVYMSGNMSVHKLRAKSPRGFGELMLTRFDPLEKDKLFKKLYASQYEKRTGEAIFAVGKELGEVILWKSGI